MSAVGYAPEIGDAVKHIVHDNVVWTVYDKDDDTQMAQLNWVDADHRMVRMPAPFDMLKRAKRQK
jgi:hypothetical protein